MEIKIKLKHLIIPIIVFTISFVVIINDYRLVLTNPTFDVGFLYTSDNLYDKNDELLLLDTLTSFTSEQVNAGNSVKLETSSFNSINMSKLSELSNRSELIILSHTNITDDLKDFFAENMDTFYILYNCDYEGDFSDNVAAINLDSKSASNQAAVDLLNVSETGKYLYVSTTAKDEEYEHFNDTITKANEKNEVYYYQIDDVDNNTLIRSNILEYLNQGIDSIYVSDPRVSDIVIETSLSVQQDIEAYNDYLIDFQQEKEENKDSTAVLEEPKYEQNQINVITNTFKNVNNGLYYDENSNGIKEENDFSVVETSYVFDLEDTILSIRDMLVTDSFKFKEFNIKPIKE